MTGPARGHRALPHTADALLEAWGPDLASCCEEAVAALTGLCIDAAAARPVARRTVHVPAGSAASRLVAVLDEVIFTLDTADAVPIGAQVRGAGDGGLDVVLELADRATVMPSGAVPKAISRSELQVDERPGAVRCRYLVDV